MIHGRLGWGGRPWSCPSSPFQERGARSCPGQAEPHWRLGALQVLMSSPYKGEGRGVAMLNLLRILSHSIAPAMADTWELEIPLLVKYLEGEVPGVPTPSQLPSKCTGWGTNHVA